ncbi:MAG: hypothetical protein J6L86_08845 [Alphaproteobacteria bacterium]|nr:hypothetical protein [Alphaproteobacteria bacterium]
MMKKQKILVSALAVLMFSAAGVSAQDVYVDLSVLDSLGTDSSASSSPLFPVVSPESRPVKKAVKKAPHKAKKQVKKAVRAEKDVVSIPQKSEIKVENLKPATNLQPDLSSEKAQIKDQPVNKAAAAEILGKAEKTISEAENAPVLSPVSADVKNDSAENNGQTAIAPVEMPENDENALMLAERQPAPQTAEPELLVPVKPAESKTLFTPPAAEQPSVPAERQVSAADNRIIFAEDVSELSEDHKKQIDAVISGFEDPKNNKIAIFSYNYDNGEDVFRKKRMSLNRAVEIRSYLLGKGYKNFSIKVINVNEADKNNLVTVVELK